MLAADRRMGIVSILVACGHATTRELARLPHIYKARGRRGVFIMEGYKPYNNTLTLTEQERLKAMYHTAEGEDKKIKAQSSLAD